jgi:hypothetical protein
MDPAVVDHSTDVLLVPVTVAENCLVLPEATLVLAGFTLTLMLVGVDGGFTVTVAEALASMDAALVAVTVKEDVVETVGAVSKPVLEIEPAVLDQVTAVLVDPTTVAKNCCVPPDASVERVGEI